MFKFFIETGFTSLLIQEPVGWDGIDIRLKRSDQWHGFFDYFDEKLTGLEFDSNAFDRLQELYEDDGVDADATLLIQFKCEDTDDFEDLYEGKFDFTTYEEICSDRCFIQISIVTTSCMMALKNRYEQKVDIKKLESFDGTALADYVGLNENLTLETKVIRFISNMEIENETTQEFTSGIQPTSIAFTWLMTFEYDKLIKTDIDVTDNFSYANVGTLQEFCQTQSPILLFQSSAIKCPGTVTVNTRLKGDLSEHSLDSRNYTLNVSLAHLDINCNVKHSESLQSGLGGAFGGGATNNKSFDVTDVYSATFEEGDFFIVYLSFTAFTFTTGTAGVGVSHPSNVTVEFELGSVEMILESICPATDADVLLVNETLSRITESITDDCLRAYSDYYGRTDAEPYVSAEDGCAGLRCITNGLSIRNATIANDDPAKMFISLKDLFEGLNCIDNIGMGTEDDPNRAGFKLLRVEPVDYFYQNTVIFTATQISELKRRIATEKIYSTYLGGYATWETENTGGLDDIHAKREYRTDSKEVSGTLNRQCNIIGSCYTIEVTRRIGQTTEDWKYDNNIFIIVLNRLYDGYRTDLFIPASFDKMITADLYYNQRISPVRNALRWFKSIAASWSKTYDDVTKKLRFMSGEGNYVGGWRYNVNDDCLLEDQTNLLYEDTDIDQTDFKNDSDARPIWQPEVVEFDYPLTYQEFKNILANPYGTIQFQCGETGTGRGTESGYLLDLKYSPVDGLAEFTILLKM